MFQNNLKRALRAIWNNRLFTALNVVGLAIGLSAAWVVWQYTVFEKSHNTQIADAGRLFRVVSHFAMDGKASGNAGCPEPLHRAAETISGIEKTVPVVDLWTLNVLPEGCKKPINEAENVVKTTPAYFEILPYKWLSGSRTMALSRPNEVVLTQKRAEIYFPRLLPSEVLGKTLVYNFMQDTVRTTVVGVVECLGFPTSFIGEEFVSFQKKGDGIWSNTNSGDQLFIVLEKNADPKTVEKTINEVSDKNSKADLEKWKMSRSLALQPLAKVHFDPEFAGHARTANPRVMAVLPGIALFLLILACINYINLSTAQIPVRAREIGIRKTLGSGRASLVGGFLVETFLVCLMACALSFFLARWAFAFFEKDLPADVLKFADWRATGLFLSGLVAVVVLVSGLYPGWLIGRLQAVSLLKNQFLTQNLSKTNRSGLRKGLIVFQFFVAQVFIIGAMVVGRQLNFMLEKDLGFDREAVVVASVPWSTSQNPHFKNKEKALAENLRQLPEIENLALGEPLFSGNYSSNSYSRMDEKGRKIGITLFRKQGDSGFADFYKMKFLAGNGPQKGSSSNEIVLNETALKAFEFASPEAAIGQILFENGGDAAGSKVVGVCADFHTNSFSRKIQATGLMLGEADFRTFNIRLASRSPKDWPAALKNIEAEWQKNYPDDPFRARFYDETMREIYAADLSAARFVNVATGVAVLISCLGLFGLATFTALRRTKEIGVRKVLGASAASVVGLMSKEFLVLVAVGFGLAVPVAVYFLQNWLAEYAYSVGLDWWLVALAGLGGGLLAMVAIGFQSIRAAVADPVKSLRSE